MLPLLIYDIDFEQYIEEDPSINGEAVEVPEIEFQIDRRVERRLQRKYGYLLATNCNAEISPTAS